MTPDPEYSIPATEGSAPDPEVFGLSVQRGGDPTLVMSGELDVRGMDAVVDAVRALFHERPAVVVIDASGLTFIDSSGLRCLMLARQHVLDAGIEFRVSAVSDRARRVITLAGVNDLLPDE